MPLKMSGRTRIGPFVLHFGKSGWTSTSIKIGRFTRNLTRGTTSVDLPGPVSWTSGSKRRRARRAADSR